MKLALCACPAIGSAPAEEKSVSATGTWTWSTPGRDGGEAREFSAALVQDGEKLTGKLKSPGRNGAEIETGITRQSR